MENAPKKTRRDLQRVDDRKGSAPQNQPALRGAHGRSTERNSQFELKSSTISFASRTRACDLASSPPPQLKSGVSRPENSMVSFVPKDVLFIHRWLGRDESGLAAPKSE